MAELIGCRRCDSPDCRGCNVFTLDKALSEGYFKLLTDEHHTIHINADVQENIKGKWTEVSVVDFENHSIASMRCDKCGLYHNEVYFYGCPTENVNFCPNCGADMRGE